MRVPILVWLVDDADSNHTAAAHTIAALPGFAFEGFHDGEAAVEEFRLRAATDPAALPRIVLMDYYMGNTRGDEVTHELRAIHAQGFSPIIVGYSSVALASAAIVAAGGNLVVRKRVGSDGGNPDLRTYLEGFLRLA